MIKEAKHTLERFSILPKDGIEYTNVKTQVYVSPIFKGKRKIVHREAIKDFIGKDGVTNLVEQDVSYFLEVDQIRCIYRSFRNLVIDYGALEVSWEEWDELTKHLGLHHSKDAYGNIRRDSHIAYNDRDEENIQNTNLGKTPFLTRFLKPYWKQFVKYYEY